MFLYRLVQALDRAQVDYALVGGCAVALHGIVRGTIDIDLVINFSESDFIAAEKVFRSLELEPRLPVDGSQVFKFRKEYLENRNLIAWNFYNPRTLTECVDVIINQDRQKTDIKKFNLGEVTVKVASVDALIKMKTKSGRPQDLEDVKALKRLNKK